MKTRSQTKKEKLDNQKPKVPQLNEDVLGIILKYVVQKQQKYMVETYKIIRKHLDFKTHVDRMKFSNKIQWPDYLDTNMRRLVQHTNVKLFHGYLLGVNRNAPIHENIKSKEDLDLLWKTLKHFGGMSWYEHPDEIHDESMTAAEFFQRLWGWIQPKRSLIQELEKRLT